MMRRLFIGACLGVFLIASTSSAGGLHHRPALDDRNDPYPYDPQVIVVAALLTGFLLFKAIDAAVPDPPLRGEGYAGHSDTCAWIVWFEMEPCNCGVVAGKHARRVAERPAARDEGSGHAAGTREDNGNWNTEMVERPRRWRALRHRATLMPVPAGSMASDSPPPRRENG